MNKATSTEIEIALLHVMSVAHHLSVIHQSVYTVSDAVLSTL